MKIVSDPVALIVTNLVEGQFLEKDGGTTLFVAATKITKCVFSEDTLNTTDQFTLIMDDENSVDSVLVGGTLIGEALGVSGDGVLATITFGVIGEGSHIPQITDVLALGVDGTELKGCALTLEIR